MKKSFALLAVSFLLFSACGSPVEDEEDTEFSQGNSEQNQEDPVSNQEEVAAQEVAEALKEKESTCEDSGGTFSDGTCSCPEDTYGNNNSLIFTYDEKTGYCVDPDGAPGGILGTDGKGAEL